MLFPASQIQATLRYENSTNIMKANEVFDTKL